MMLYQSWVSFPQGLYTIFLDVACSIPIFSLFLPYNSILPVLIAHSVTLANNCPSSRSAKIAPLTVDVSVFVIEVQMISSLEP